LRVRIQGVSTIKYYKNRNILRRIMSLGLVN